MDFSPYKPHAKKTESDPGIRRMLQEEYLASDPSAGLVVRRVFQHFQNLNLRVLIEDLRRDQTSRGNWSFDRYLCPVSHGISSGQKVGLLCFISQAVDLRRACQLAAEDLGAPAKEIERFVESWDNGSMSPRWLIGHLEAIWDERLQDALATQAVQQPYLHLFEPIWPNGNPFAFLTL